MHPPLWEAGDKYLLELFENVKMFLHCSSFGDFEARLDLIEGFGKQCRVEAVSGFFSVCSTTGTPFNLP